MMNYLKVLLAGTVLCAAAPRALGANVESKERSAKKACLLGDVNKGADILADLYVETNDPVYIYNQGRCFEQNGKDEQAVLRFKEYLRKDSNLGKADADAVLKKIGELQRASDRHRAPTSALVPETRTPPAEPREAGTQPLTATPPSEPVAAALAGLGSSQAPLQPEPEQSPPMYKRWWLWTGIAAVVAGGAVTAVLLTRHSAPQSPGCDGEGTCVP
jgi:hypothetical protein